MKGAGIGLKSTSPNPRDLEPAPVVQHVIGSSVTHTPPRRETNDECTELLAAKDDTAVSQTDSRPKIHDVSNQIPGFIRKRADVAKSA